MAWRFLGRPLGTAAKVERAADEFAQMVGKVVNATVSQAPITFVEVQGASEPTWYIAHCSGGKVATAMPLVNGRFLYLYNVLSVRRTERFLATLEYKYAYQATEDDDSWIFRYEYLREPPTGYPYAASHVHINAVPASYTGDRPFPTLHLPTGRRVTIEQLVRHLIAEHGIVPISDQWQSALEEGEAHFRDIQRKRLLS